MAVFHGKPPEDGFTRVPNAWLRDPKIRGLAKAVLAYLLSHANGYRLTVKQMAAEFREGEDALYAAIKELRDAGYVQRVQHRGGPGQTGEVHYVVIGSDGEFPQVASASGFSGSAKPGSAVTCDDAESSQVASASGSGGSAFGGSAESGTKKNMAKKTTNLEDQEDQGSELNWRTADAARESNDLPRLVGDNGNADRTVFTDWRPGDYDLFREAIGADTIVSDGRRWTEGEHSVDAFYKAFRKHPDNPIRWPGSYLHEASGNGTLDNWLTDQGLEPA